MFDRIRARLMNKSNSGFPLFLISYLVILVVSISVGCISYVLSSNAIKKQIGRYNVAMLEQAGQMIDGYLSNINHLMTNIVLDRQINDFLNVKSLTSYDDIISAHYVMKEISRYSNTSDFIDDVYVFFKNSDIIINNSEKYDPLFYYNEVMPYTRWSFDEWKEILQQVHFKRFFPIQKISNKYIDKSVIACLQSLPISEKHTPSGTVVITINPSIIKKILDSIGVLYEGTIYIVDNTGNIILNMGNETFLDLDILSKITINSDYSYEKIDSYDVVVAQVFSRINEWRYVFVVPTYAFMHEIDHIRTLTILILLFELFIGVLLSYIFAKKNYDPIKRLVNRLRENFHSHTDKVKNELIFIEEATYQTINEKNELKKMLMQQRPIIRANVLSQLVKGNIRDIHNLDASLRSIGILFEYEWYCVAILYIDVSNDYKGDDYIEELSLKKFAIVNVLEEFFGTEYIVYTIDASLNEIHLIINLKEHTDSCKNDIISIINKTKNLMEKEAIASFTTGIGKIRKGVREISISYMEAKKALEYRLLKGEGSIIVYEDISFKQKEYIYSHDIEIRLINYIRAGDVEQVMNMLNEIFQKIFEDNNISIEVARCLFFDIMGSALKILSSIDVNYEVIFGTDFKPANEIISCKTVLEMKELLKEIYIKVCEYVNDSKKSRNEILINNVLEYINNHYCEDSFCLTSVADYFNMNAAYLSYLFKELVGENFADYICKLRIEKVKELLMYTSMPISQIAQNVCYANASYLIRLFKKVEGITPGKYREQRTIFSLDENKLVSDTAQR